MKRSLAAAIAAVLLALSAGGQEAGPGERLGRGVVPWFDVGVSPIELSGDVRSGAYVAAVGRRAIAMGTEDGRFEIWSWPYKWLHDFQLAFRVPRFTDPVAGRSVARRVVSRPEGVTIEYSYETFTVRQLVFPSIDQPVVFMLLEVDAIRPMEIVVSFRPDIHLAWPASLGGQYLAWNAPARAFLFSESRRRVNAFLGSPAVTRASDVPAHMLAEATPQFTIAVGDEGQRYTEPRLGEPPGGNVDIHEAWIPIVLAGGEMHRDSARALYERMSEPGAAHREWLRRVAHFRELGARTLRIRTPDTTLNRAVEWAKVNLDEAMVCNPDLGCGLVAGYGLSGAASDRPGFGWFFGGDASINSLAMTAVGLHDAVREGVFSFFARYQRADGKITHEISQGAGRIDWFGQYPYAFYHGDTTPFWILAFGEYWRQTADTALARELWPKLRKAFEWSRSTDSDGDGLMENPLAGAGALEVGDLQIGIVSDVYLSGVWVAALERFAALAQAMGEGALATEATSIRERALRTLESRLWMPGLGQYAFALLEGGRINENLTAWPATAMSFGLFDADRGAAMAERMASAELTTDWGTRPLSARSTLFDPLHYNNGAVWPFVTGWVALGQYRYFNRHAGRFALDAIVRTGFDDARGRNPEVISGRLYRPLDTSVPHQFFATSMVLTPLVRGLLGITVDAPRNQVAIAPQLPPEWDSVSVVNVPVGRASLSFTLRRDPGSLMLDVEGSAAPLEVEYAPALPLGATGARTRINGGNWTSVPARNVPGAVLVSQTARTAVNVRTRLEFAWEGGWEVAPVTEPARIGDRSRALRVVSERFDGGRYRVTLQGRAGSEGEVLIRTPDRRRPQSITLLPAAASTSPLRLSAPDGKGWSRLGISFPATDADADGYVTIVLVM
ncbi:MAG: amylo-alpha-1,6-glucosidase [Gemmatimonadota bacterium]